LTARSSTRRKIGDPKVESGPRTDALRDSVRDGVRDSVRDRLPDTLREPF
jgi:hypothetical protein